MGAEAYETLLTPGTRCYDDQKNISLVTAATLDAQNSQKYVKYNSSCQILENLPLTDVSRDSSHANLNLKAYD
jgi:hypothetical protein